ncbi:MAG TPA: hypothetical protein VEN81_02200 [Planctomycetota bacterium]|nr:hypothetical protein [Planctomycetota bacterium]
MSSARRPRISVESSDPSFRAFSLLALEDLGPFAVVFRDPTAIPSPSSPAPDLLLLDRRYRPFSAEWRALVPSLDPRQLQLPIVVVTDLPDVSEIAHEFGTGRSVHVLRDSGDPGELAEEVHRIWLLQPASHRYN